MFGNKTISRPLRITLIVITILLSPLSLLAGLVVFNAINPMALVFLTSFTIDNKSGQDIWVSPIGAIGKDGYRHPLPFCYFRFPCIRSPKRTDFYIAKDTSRTFVYDWDDIQFSEILIRPEQGNTRFILIDPNPTQKQYRKLKNTFFTVSSLSELSGAPPNLTSALAFTDSAWRMYGLPTIGLIPPILIFVLYKTRKNLTGKKV